MSKNDPPVIHYPVWPYNDKQQSYNLAEVLHREAREIDARCANDSGIVSNLHLGPRAEGDPRPDRFAVAFSGGGIRSACVSLGVSQSLARHRVLRQAHYFSAISGGGYFLGWLTAWTKRARNFKLVEKQLGDLPPQLQEAGAYHRYIEPNPIHHLRQYSSYLTPRLGLLSGDSLAMISVYLRNLLLNFVMMTSGMMTIMLVLQLFEPQRFWLSPLGDYQMQVELTLTGICFFFAVRWVTQALGRIRYGITYASSRSEHIKPLLAGFLGCALAWHTSPTFYSYSSYRIAIIGLIAGLGVFGMISSRAFGKYQTSRRAAKARWGRWTFLLAHPRLWVRYLRASVTLRTAYLGRVISRRKNRQPAPAAADPRTRRRTVSPIDLPSGRFLILVWAGAVIAALIACAIFIHWLRRPYADGGTVVTTPYVVFGFPLVLTAFPLVSYVFLGLMGKSFADAEREWLARFAGFFLAGALAVSIVLGIALEGYTVVNWLLGKLLGESQWYKKLLTGILPGGWLFVVVTGILGGRAENTSGKESNNHSLSFVIAIAPPAFLAGSLLLVSWATQTLVDKAEHWIDVASHPAEVQAPTPATETQPNLLVVKRSQDGTASHFTVQLLKPNGHPLSTKSVGTVPRHRVAPEAKTSAEKTLAPATHKSPPTSRPAIAPSATPAPTASAPAPAPTSTPPPTSAAAATPPPAPCTTPAPPEAPAADSAATPSAEPAPEAHIVPSPSVVHAEDAQLLCRWKHRFEAWLPAPLVARLHHWRDTPGLFSKLHTSLSVFAQRPLPHRILHKLKSIWGNPDLQAATLYALLLLLFTSIAGAFAWRLDVNEFSMHLFYRNRLVRAFLGASVKARDTQVNRFTGFSSEDDIPLCTLTASRGFTGPYPIWGTTLNITKGEDLGWQQRKGASFLYSPLSCGWDYVDPTHAPPALEHPTSSPDNLAGHAALAPFGYRSTRFYSGLRDGEGQSLIGTAMAASGAAASPNMGYHTRPGVAALLAIFNVRLGWWTGNPRNNLKWKEYAPPIAYLLKELMGATDDKSDYVYLSDGGHFENLGLYELIRRRVRFIISSDAAADAHFGFGDLGNAIERCRRDFGVEINLGAQSSMDLSDTPPFRSAHYALGEIDYGDFKGILLYLKSSLTDDEPGDVLSFQDADKSFPHDTTANQFFTEAMFEAYRALGQHMMDKIFDQCDMVANKANEPHHVVPAFYAKLSALIEKSSSESSPSPRSSALSSMAATLKEGLSRIPK